MFHTWEHISPPLPEAEPTYCLRNQEEKRRHLNREILSRWADSCAEQGGQVINLTLETYEFLRPNAWIGELCNEHVEKINGKLGKLEDLKEQFSKDQLSTGNTPNHSRFKAI